MPHISMVMTFSIWSYYLELVEHLHKFSDTQIGVIIVFSKGGIVFEYFVKVFQEVIKDIKTFFEFKVWGIFSTILF